MRRALLTGWFSVPGGEATAGDLLAMELIREALEDDGYEVAVATNEGFVDGHAWEQLDPATVDRLVFTCGPLHGPPVERLVDRFAEVPKVAVNVSVVDRQLAERFDAVIARDGDDHTRADITLAARPADVPVVGVVRAHPQEEYGDGAYAQVDAAIAVLLASRPCAVVDFDTRVHPAADPLAKHARTAAEVLALAARMDVVVTSRLHGLVLALSSGTPAVAVDPVAGGAKVLAQARRLDWPAVTTADRAEPEDLWNLLDWCLSDEARERAARCAAAGAEDARAVLDAFREAVRG